MHSFIYISRFIRFDEAWLAMVLTGASLFTKPNRTKYSMKSLYLIFKRRKKRSLVVECGNKGAA
ncbi:MAG: hypothetical protein A3D96_05815 [Chlamydiae bacterium RIFCSPHIGHO2_12_FULL_44_59]|nr:MAG: hypothetical protein A3D96_05815 [Chlamydiae bacterium RIFCSPHIGHO2_12_FULL_44_59]OGN65616.1 MAG: hypothetical protein A2978_06620 [Chlamydiae bacterium RIFCSPLOWO2_01_FULL_44_52]OGN68093.1 MAG: hypothetical protein A3I67_05290 [Chlamydiae bacterium RIFCSPLOWO2_02_FULL_45_22]